MMLERDEGEVEEKEVLLGVFYYSKLLMYCSDDIHYYYEITQTVHFLH